MTLSNDKIPGEDPGRPPGRAKVTVTIIPADNPDPDCIAKMYGHWDNIIIAYWGKKNSPASGRA